VTRKFVGVALCVFVRRFWLWNDPNPADVDDPTARGWRTLLELPMPGRNLSPEEKAMVEDSVNWLRNNELKRGRQRAHSRL
jgi:hypothetical protein